MRKGKGKVLGKERRNERREKRCKEVGREKKKGERNHL